MLLAKTRVTTLATGTASRWSYTAYMTTETVGFVCAGLVAAALVKPAAVP
ncbi:MAG: hypothetical protein ABSG56_39070 [Bryobacteraceae bacterium]|jgi:hypothetical protein